MVLLQQLFDLLSGPPGSIVFHLVTLFALQIVLALSYVRWQRDPGDESARRMMFAAGGILAVRLLLVLGGLLSGLDPERLQLVLPPLEQAVNAATAVLIVWGLVLVYEDRPRLADAALLVVLVVIAVMFFFFYQDWVGRAPGGVNGYFGTPQAFIWAIIQLVVLAAGMVWLILDKRTRLTLRPFILGVLVLAHALQLWSIPDPFVEGGVAPVWVRLGYLIAFPLWAVLAYRENMQYLTGIGETGGVAPEKLSETLAQATLVIGARVPPMRLERALDMVMALVPAQFAAIGLIDQANSQRVVFNHYRPTPTRETGHGWQLDLSGRSSLRLAFEQQRGVELLPRGVGARQVHELAQQFNLGPIGPTFIEPLLVRSRCVGFLILAAPSTMDTWTEETRAIVPGAAAFIAQAIANSRSLENELEAHTASELATAEDQALRTALDQTQAELSRTRRQLAAAEARLQKAQAARAAAVKEVVTRPQLAPTTPVLPVIEEAVSTLLPTLRAKKLQLDLMVDNDLPPVGVGQEVLQQLVASLLDNACRASAEESCMTLRAGVAGANGQDGPTTRVLDITVIDTGRGIGRDESERVFDSQYFLSGAPPINGLGDSSAKLAVARKLAQVSGGDIGFQSTLGEGSSFALRLPVADVLPPITETNGIGSPVSHPTADAKE
ncbi:MAG: ATP-binding protein [Chloroflexota bacterium]